MTLEEFVKKYNGKKVDYDNAYGAQCVDLFRQYTKEALGIKEHTGPCATSGGAKDLFLDYDKMPVEKKYFTRSKGKAYQPGDVLVWDATEKNKYGHVAIFLAYLGNGLLVFEQNGITQAGAEIQVRTRDNMLGYLRKR
jgi:cell wall-associated NlpC family hydrolase